MLDRGTWVQKLNSHPSWLPSSLCTLMNIKYVDIQACMQSGDRLYEETSRERRHFWKGKTFPKMVGCSQERKIVELYIHSWAKTIQKLWQCLLILDRSLGHHGLRQLRARVLCGYSPGPTERLVCDVHAFPTLLGVVEALPCPSQLLLG